jgi:CheY-like chemotaxis protein
VTVKRVLLVEDDPHAREIYGEILEYAGFAVSLAVDGEEALGLARSETPALILMDIHLPLLSGWDALQALKDDPRTRAIPVVAITANGGHDNLERATTSAFESYHVKPLSPGNLLAEVRRLIGEPSEDTPT